MNVPDQRLYIDLTIEVIERGFDRPDTRKVLIVVGELRGNDTKYSKTLSELDRENRD